MRENKLSFIVEKKKKFDLEYQNAKIKIEERQKIKEKYEEGLKILKEVESDKDALNVAKNFLKNWYVRQKKNRINSLQEQINEYLSMFFLRKFNLEFEETVKRGKENVELIERTGDYSEDKKDVLAVLSGAESQLVGMLTQLAALKGYDSNFLVLDEAFSSFGIKEVSRIPELLSMLEDMQIIIIEHKNELFKNTNYNSIGLNIKDGTTVIQESGGGDNCNMIYQETK